MRSTLTQPNAHVTYCNINFKCLISSVLTFISCCALTSCSSAQECKEGINLLPMYGKVVKCDEQLKADKAFFEMVDKENKDRKKASAFFAERGWDFFYKSDLESSMKRFNQAWLLDSLNADVYWGFGNILGRQNQFQESISFFQRSLQLNPNNAKVYESLSASYGQLFIANHQQATLEQAVQALNKANSLDKDNPRILAGLTAAYCYYYQGDSASKYLKLTDKIDPQAISPQVREMVKRKMK